MASKKANAPDATKAELDQLRELDAKLHGYPIAGTNIGLGPWAPPEQTRTTHRRDVAEVRDTTDPHNPGPVTGYEYEVDESLAEKLDKLPDAAAHGLTQAQIARMKQLARSSA